MLDTEVNFYIGNHASPYVHISDFVNLARLELSQLGVPMSVSTTLHAKKINIILECFSEPRLVDVIIKNFEERDPRLWMIATEIMKDGFLDSSSPSPNEQVAGHYNPQSKLWLARTEGFHKVVSRFGRIICPAEPIVQSLKDYIDSEALVYWTLRYMSNDLVRDAYKESFNVIPLSKTSHGVFSGTLTSYRSSMLDEMTKSGLKIDHLTANSPDFVRYSQASHSLFQLAPKHYLSTRQVSKMRLHWALNNDFPILVDKCDLKSDLDEFVIQYNSVDELLSLIKNENTGFESRALTEKFKNWSSTKVSSFSPMVKYSLGLS
jgi:hypothetical protein